MARDDELKRIEGALLDLVSTRPFHSIRLAEIAEAAGLDLATLRRSVDGRIGVLESFARRMDVAVLEGVEPAGDGSTRRERLFDVLMRRFDLLAPHRAGLRGLERSARRDPLLALQLGRIALGSQGWMLEASGISTTGLIGRLRPAALAGALARCLPTFLADEEEGLPETMAMVDETLTRLEGVEKRVGRVRGALARLCCGKRRRDDAPSATTTPSAAVVSAGDANDGAQPAEG